MAIYIFYSSAILDAIYEKLLTIKVKIYGYSMYILEYFSLARRQFKGL